MTNAKLIAALRYCADADYDCRDGKCPYYEKQPQCSMYDMMEAAADALEAAERRIAELEAQMPKEGEWIMDEDPHDGDCRCSVCLIAIDAMHERNHGRLNALTGGNWWQFYRYCPNCGAKMDGKENADADS